MEAARAFERLMDEAQLTQEASRSGPARIALRVGNSIGILKLEPKIQEWIEEGN